MSPCKGCRDQVEKVMVKLRFIGKPGGRLMKGAPGNYMQGQIVTGPADRAKYFPKIWQLAEDMPELIIPKATEVESVFDPDLPDEVDDSPSSPKEFNLLDPDRSSARSFHRVGALPPLEVASTDSSKDEVDVSEMSPTVENLEKSKVAELKAFIDSQGAKYTSNMRKPELLELAKSLLPE